MRTSVSRDAAWRPSRTLGRTILLLVVIVGSLSCRVLAAAASSRLALQLAFGVTDPEASAWDGELQCSDGVTIESAGVLDLYPAKHGGLQESGGRALSWQGTSKRDVMRTWFSKEIVKDPQGNPIHFPLKPFAFFLQLVLGSPGTLTVSTRDHGQFQVVLSDLQYGRPLEFLDGRVRAERVVPTVALDSCTAAAGGIRYNDFPALCVRADGSVCAAYLAYTGRPQANSPLSEAPRSFDFLQQAPGNDQLLVVCQGAGAPGAPVAVTGPGLDLFHPAIAADRQGRTAVVWSQSTGRNWDLYASVCRDGVWSAPACLTTDPYPDIYAAAVCSGNEIWVAWQSFSGGTARLLLGRLAQDGSALDSVVELTDGSANAWMPALAADSRGNLAVAYDTYAKGDYDVYCIVRLANGTLTKPLPIATSLKYEAKASVAYDGQNRLWLAWEEAGENWAKDCRSKPEEGFAGEPIEYQRSLRVACLDGEACRMTVAPLADLLPPQQEIGSVFGKPVRTRESIFGESRRLAFSPRLAGGADGRIYLAFRQHNYLDDKALQLQTCWSDYVSAYAGGTWTVPVLVAGSDGFRHCAPAIGALPEGGVALVVAGDGRASVDRAATFRSQTVRLGRFVLSGAAVAPPQVMVAGPVLAAVAPPAVAAEREAVQRLRNLRLVLAGREYRLVRGDFHRHTAFSPDSAVDDGSIEDAFRYALDAAALDFMSNGDHDNGGAEYPWYVTQKLYDIHLLPGRFVSMFGYERSRGEHAIGGHRNVIMAKRGIRALPGFGVEKTDETGSVQDTRMLYRCLREIGAVSIPHTIGTGAGPNFVDYAPDVDPVVEIFQGARNSYEYPDCPRGLKGGNSAGFFWNLLKAGKTYGVVSSSDHHSTHISYAMLYVSEMSREGVLDALRRRHCYAATDNILLDVRAGRDHMMGDLAEVTGAPTLAIEVVGTGPLESVDIMRNAAIYHTVKPGVDSLRLTWTDPAPLAGESSYYVRVIQQDGQMAWGSPIWARPAGTPQRAVPPTPTGM